MSEIIPPPNKPFLILTSATLLIAVTDSLSILSDVRIVILLGPEIAGENSSEVIAIWADHIGLAGFARQYFEYLLKDSKKA